MPKGSENCFLRFLPKLLRVKQNHDRPMPSRTRLPGSGNCVAVNVTFPAETREKSPAVVENNTGPRLALGSNTAGPVMGPISVDNPYVVKAGALTLRITACAFWVGPSNPWVLLMLFTTMPTTFKGLKAIATGRPPLNVPAPTPAMLNDATPFDT